MNDLVERVTRELDKLVQPYLGRQEYGNLRKTEVWSVPLDSKMANVICWFLIYEDPTGSSCSIIAEYDKNEAKFKYADEDGQKITLSPQEGLDFFRRKLESIKSHRLESLRLTAVVRKEQGDTLEIALERVRLPVREKKPYAAIAEELKFYEGYCREIYPK